MINPTTTSTNKAPGRKTYPVNYVQQGIGSPVILIHGLAASLHDWDDLIPALAATSHSVYALDLLGHGESGKPRNLSEYNVDTVFDHFSAWIDSLQIAQPMILIGHSLGGYIALQYALLHPQRVKALVLANPFFSKSQLPLLLRINYGRPLISTTMIQYTPEWLFRRVIDLTSLSIRNGYALSRAVRNQTAADYKRAHPGIFNIIHSVIDFTPWFPCISQPTLVMWGSRDQTLASSSFSKIIPVIPNARGNSISGARHVPHQSHPEEFNKQTLEFLVSLKDD
jgi:3-oxoadipate enol-lactonase